MMAELEPIMKKNLPKAILSRDNLYDYFIMRARANLHIALCFSPVSSNMHQIVIFSKLLSYQDWGEIPQPFIEVSWINLGLYHGLVSKMAGRCKS